MWTRVCARPLGPGGSPCCCAGLALGPAAAAAATAAAVCAWLCAAAAACSSADSPPGGIPSAPPAGAPGAGALGAAPHALTPAEPSSSAWPTVTSSHCSREYALPLHSCAMSARAYTSTRRRRASTTGRQLTPASSSRPSATVSGVLDVTVCSGCSFRHCRRSLESGMTSECATLASGLHVPSGRLPSGRPSSGRLATLARKCRMSEDSTPERLAACSTTGTPPPPLGSAVSTGAMEQLCAVSAVTTRERSSSGCTCTSGLACRPSAAPASRMLRIVCTSISASDSGLAPPAMLDRSAVSRRMKSDAEMTPHTVSWRPSHSGALATPCSCSAWKACRTGRSTSKIVTRPLSGMSSNAVCECKKSPIFLRVYSGSLGLWMTIGVGGPSTFAMSVSSSGGGGGACPTPSPAPRPTPDGAASGRPWASASGSTDRFGSGTPAAPATDAAAAAAPGASSPSASACCAACA
mmetsp:Transcript_25490/g.75348  ORF Transcript_25490/g.75348 Transcript_25490/m.75348 type:complete len:466 (-) Transcript_25490:782-2179(-)